MPLIITLLLKHYCIFVNILYLMFAILFQLLLLFLYKCEFAYVIRIVDLSFICKS